MIPISDDNPTLRAPLMVYAILAVTIGVWVLVQGAGLDPFRLAASVCDLGFVPGEITHLAPLDFRVPLGPGLDCAIDDQRINIYTPLISIFLHGGWAHLLGNLLFFWVFGNNVEDSMGRMRFLVFYLVCGLAAAAAHLLIDPRSPVPTVGASGAISGILGAYLVLYPKVRIKLLIPIIIIPYFVKVRAWLVLLWWFLWQVIAGLPQLMSLRPEVSGGVAVWAHIGGFMCGALLVKFFEDEELVRQRSRIAAARSA